MAIFVKGNAVDNATGYELYEKTNGIYNLLAEGTAINFEVSALGLSEGDHVLVVKAVAEGYTDSEYSKEVTYTVENAGAEDGGSGDTVTTAVYGTLISSPTNLRGGAVDYIIVRPEFYDSILNKKITKIRVYRTNDSSDSTKTTIGIGKVALSGTFNSDSQTVSGLATAYTGITSYKTYDVSSYTTGSVMELDCDITLADGEYLCFETKNGHCVGYCNDEPSVQQMMYVYNNQVSPVSGSATSQHTPISVTVEE